jgi:hypothetical protein
MKEKAFTLILLALVIGLIIMPATAQNMTISRLGFGSDETIQIYENGTTLYGTWNTTTNGIELPDGDFNIVIKPVNTDPMADPTGWLTTNIFPWVQTNFVGIAFVIVCIIWLRRSG